MSVEFTRRKDEKFPRLEDLPPKPRKKREPKTVVHPIDIPFTLAEAAALGSLSVSALRKRCQRGEAGFKVGKTWVLTKDEAYRLQDEGRRAAGRPLRPIAGSDDPPETPPPGFGRSGKLAPDTPHE